MQKQQVSQRQTPVVVMDLRGVKDHKATQCTDVEGQLRNEIEYLRKRLRDCEGILDKERVAARAKLMSMEDENDRLKSESQAEYRQLVAKSEDTIASIKECHSQQVSEREHRLLLTKAQIRTLEIQVSELKGSQMDVWQVGALVERLHYEYLSQVSLALQEGKVDRAYSMHIIEQEIKRLTVLNRNLTSLRAEEKEKQKNELKDLSS